VEVVFQPIEIGDVQDDRSLAAEMKIEQLVARNASLCKRFVDVADALAFGRDRVFKAQPFAPFCAFVLIVRESTRHGLSEQNNELGIRDKTRGALRCQRMEQIIWRGIDREPVLSPVELPFVPGCTVTMAQVEIVDFFAGASIDGRMFGQIMEEAARSAFLGANDERVR
jgi:hypothetical protein